MHAEVVGMRTVNEAGHAYRAQTQGHLAYHMGNLREAPVTFQAAAIPALLRGEIYDAETSFVYAALAAASRGRFYEAKRLSQAAALLRKLPLLYAEERIALTHPLADLLGS